MSIFSRNDKIVKIMDAAGNTIIDLNTLHQTDIVQTDCSMPLYFTAEAAGNAPVKSLKPLKNQGFRPPSAASWAAKSTVPADS